MKMVRLLVLVMVLCLSNVSNATLQVYYTFDDASGLVISDGGAYGTHDGTASASSLTFEAGKYGNAAKFSGQYIAMDIADAATLPGDVEGSDDADFTVSFWMNTASTTQMAVFAYAVNGVKLVINTDPTLGIFAGATDFGSTANNAQYHSYTTNEWHHIAVTVADGLVTLYYDGSNDGVGSTTGILSHNTGAAWLGARNLSTKKYYNGMLDDFAIFDEALTESQIAAIYSSTMAIPEPATIAMLVMGCCISFFGKKK